MYSYRKRNRRAEPRYYFYSQTALKWQPNPSRQRFFRGWLHNTSKHGLAFVADSRRVPRVGETVEVRINESEPRVYRVVRIVQFDKRVTLIGCEQDAGLPLVARFPSGRPSIEIRVRSVPRRRLANSL